MHRIPTLTLGHPSNSWWEAANGLWHPLNTALSELSNGDLNTYIKPTSHTNGVILVNNPLLPKARPWPSNSRSISQGVLITFTGATWFTDILKG